MANRRVNMRQKTTNEILEEINKRFDIKTPMGKLIANTEIIISKLNDIIGEKQACDCAKPLKIEKKDLTKKPIKRKKKLNCSKME
jgi:hypothetical protein